MLTCLVHSSLDRAVRLQALAREIALHSWARHFALTVPLSTQVHKWVLVNLKELNTRTNPEMDSHPGGIRNTLSYRSQCRG